VLYYIHMFENNPPQNLPTAKEPQDMLDATEKNESPTQPPSISPMEVNRTNSDPHSGGFRFGESGIENGPSALDAGKLRPISGGSDAVGQPLEIVTPRAQTQSVPESVAGMGTAPLEESLFSKHRVLFGVLIGLVVFGGIAYGAMMLLLRDSNTSEVPKVINKEEVVAPVEQVDAIIPSVTEEQNSETTSSTSEMNVTQTTTTTNIIPGDVVNISVDVDGDGLTEEEEIKNGTDPKKTDTDGDGLTDKEEINIWKSNPLVADTDGDGFSDGAEVKNNYSPIGSGRIFDNKSPTVNP